MSVSARVTMSFNAKPNIFEKEKALRRYLTESEEISQWGIKVVRFTNEEIENDIVRGLNENEHICKIRSLNSQSHLQGILGYIKN